MIILTRMLLIIIACFFGAIQGLYAEETDQFTLPSTALYDQGPDASAKLYAVLEQIVHDTNSKISQYSTSHSKHAIRQLQSLLKGDDFADTLYKRTGPGYPRWLRDNRVYDSKLPRYYKELRPWKTVYWLVFSQSPFSLIGLAPTINMYNHYFGTDKLGHFFMQGHTYYTIYNYFIKHNKTAQQAHDLMILYGQFLEQTYLGTLINGVYSNGDLSANYAGWKFYLNLTHTVVIGKHKVSPILILHNQQWSFSPRITKSNLLKPYISDNLNEALNPCRYSFMRARIGKLVAERCPAWIDREHITFNKIQSKLAYSRFWHGENYGHWLPAKDAVTLELCFK